MTTPDAEDRCANVSRRLDEPMASTASLVMRWLLIEQPGPWGRQALIESRLDPAVAADVDRRAKAVGARPVLIRRGVASSAGGSDRPRSWFTVNCEPGSVGVSRGEFTADHELLDVDLHAALTRAPAWSDGPLFLVCTNGRHDPCCAEFGRPVYRRLREDLPDALVFECSHIGGDRFAANVVCLPDGTYYGRVPAEDAPTLVRNHSRGEVALDFYRGASIHQPVEQAAEIALRRRLGVRHLDAVTVLSSARATDDAPTVSPPRWTVTMSVRNTGDHADGVWHAEVEGDRASGRRNLVCHGAEERPPVHRVLSLARS